MSIVAASPAESQVLTTSAKVKAEMGITVADFDALIIDHLATASGLIAEWIGRPLAREAVTEGQAGNDRQRLVLERTPLVSVQTVRLQGSALASTDFLIEDRAKGFLFNSNRWRLSASGFTGITVTKGPEPGEEIWSVDYVGGWYLPSFVNNSGVITGATQANPVVITDSAHGLVTGDRISISGVTGMTQINGKFFQVTRVDDNSFSLDGEDGTSHGAYVSGGVWSVQPLLPQTIERAAIELTVSLFQSRGRDRNVISERLGDWSETRKSSDDPFAAHRSMVRPYARVEM